MPIHFPNESSEYRAARNALLEKEIALRRLTEEVAQARRALPPGGIAEDYLFQGDGPVRLSQLFEPGHDTLAIYSYMFGPEKQSPCRMCTPMLDAFNAISDNVRQRLSLVVVAESPPERLRAWTQLRRWNLRLVSCAGNRYNREYYGKWIDQDVDTTMLNVFKREGDKVRHFWGSELAHGPNDPGQDHRGLDTVNPTFGLFDFTPEGRGDFLTKVAYDFVVPKS